MASLALAFDITARDAGATRTFRNVGDAAQTAGRRGEGFGSAMRRGIGLAAGALAAAGLGRAFAGFITDAAEAARVGRLTTSVLESTGGAANVTAEGIAELSNRLSLQAGIDDEVIQSASNVLLTFTRVRNEMGRGNKVFDYAQQAALNMSAALGTDLQSATIQVGKALNDPIAGLTSLTRAGVQFTDAQKEQITAMMEAGDVMGAQKIILAELETQFGGAAEAAADPMERMKVAIGNIGESIGTVLLPYVQQFASWIGEKAAPAIQTFLDQFGTGEDGTPGGNARMVVEKIAGAGEWLADVWTTKVYPALQTFWGYLTGTVVPAVASFIDYIRDEAGPMVEKFAAWWRDSATPALQDAAGVVKKTLGPQLEQLRVQLEDQMVPALGGAKTAFDDENEAMGAALSTIGKFLGAIGLFVLYVQVQLWKALAGIITLLAKLGEFFVRLTGLASDMGYRFGTAIAIVEYMLKRFFDRIRNFKLPGWIQALADALGNIVRNLGRVTGGLAGSVRSGLSGIASVLPSFHTGGVVQASAPRMPGFAPNERLAKVLVGETVLPPGVSAAGGGGPMEITGTLDLGNGLIGVMRGVATQVVGEANRTTARAVAAGAGAR